MEKGRVKPRVRDLLKGVSLDPGKLKSLEEAGSRLAEACKILDHALRDLGVYGLASVYEELRGCTEEYTVVYNRAKKPYYYWYLKCTGRDKRVKSIYLGKSPEGYNTVKNAAKAASEAVAAAARLRGVVEELDKALRDLTDKLTQLTMASAVEGFSSHMSSYNLMWALPHPGSPASRSDSHRAWGRSGLPREPHILSV